MSRAIKKPGVPNGTPDWLKTIVEIQLGRRGNAIIVPSLQTLTFSATPRKPSARRFIRTSTIFARRWLIF